MHQKWRDALFIHWPVDPQVLRGLIPQPLSIDTFDGQAWIGITPFKVESARPKFMPMLAWLSDFHEVNVRTYVHLNGAPGVWFFSLDANSRMVVSGARALVNLPYRHADIAVTSRDGRFDWRCRRDDAEAPGTFEATWTVGAKLPAPEPGSLAFFLVERYALYTTKGQAIEQGRVFHSPWLLREATVTKLSASLVKASGLPEPGKEIVVHASPGVEVDLWPVESVR